MLLHIRTGQQGGGGLPVSFGRFAGGTTTSPPTRGFLSLMRAATALLGYAVMARLSLRTVQVPVPTARSPRVRFS